MRGLVARSESAAPQAWRLESLCLANCDLRGSDWVHFTRLPEAQTLLSGLRWLDLSDNPQLLAGDDPGLPSWMALWQFSPLLSLNLCNTGR